jgi:glutamate-1-semialdehyde aminotransferase
MNWMTRWPGAWPVAFEAAQGARLTDVDGNAYVDFCLGDTGAMAGHSPVPTVAAAAARMAKGIATMLPSEDAGPVGEEMSRRFGPRHWQFSLTATDASTSTLHADRGVLMTPFHMMALMSPATTESDVEAHTEVLREFAAELTA